MEIGNEEARKIAMEVHERLWTSVHSRACGYDCLDYSLVHLSGASIEKLRVVAEEIDRLGSGIVQFSICSDPRRWYGTDVRVVDEEFSYDGAVQEAKSRREADPDFFYLLLDPDRRLNRLLDPDRTLSTMLLPGIHYALDLRH